MAHFPSSANRISITSSIPMPLSHIIHHIFWFVPRHKRIRGLPQHVPYQQEVGAAPVNVTDVAVPYPARHPVCKIIACSIYHDIAIFCLSGVGGDMLPYRIFPIQRDQYLPDLVHHSSISATSIRSIGPSLTTRMAYRLM